MLSILWIKRWFGTDLLRLAPLVPLHQPYAFMSPYSGLFKRCFVNSLQETKTTAPGMLLVSCSLCLYNFKSIRISSILTAVRRKQSATMNKLPILACSSRLAESMVNKTPFHHISVNKNVQSSWCCSLQIMSLLDVVVLVSCWSSIRTAIINLASECVFCIVNT